MSNTNEVDIYILASGKGTRMGELTATTPKPLLPLHEKPIIRRLLGYLLNREIFNISVNYAYLKEKWQSLIKEYNSVSFFNTSSNKNIVQCFFNMIMQNECIHNTIVLMSADIFFDYRIIEEAIKHHNAKNHKVTVVLNKNCGKWKRWKYIIESDEIFNIQIADDIQPVERYFLIFSANALTQYTNNFTTNIGENNEEFMNNIAYGQGLCFLVKNMLDAGIKINTIFYENKLININNIDDYREAEALAAELDIG